jgi:hypothetical protein
VRKQFQRNREAWKTRPTRCPFRHHRARASTTTA